MKGKTQKRLAPQHRVGKNRPKFQVRLHTDGYSYAIMNMRPEGGGRFRSIGRVLNYDWAVEVCANLERMDKQIESRMGKTTLPGEIVAKTGT